MELVGSGELSKTKKTNREPISDSETLDFGDFREAGPLMATLGEARLATTISGPASRDLD